MPSIIYTLIFLFLTNFLIQPTTCALQDYIQNLELDDVTSLWDKFPSFIGKIKDAINRFRCPKGWRRLGGSCYYLSNITSTSIEANDTCNLLHSNHSNLMQIRNTIELFYAAHVLTKNNLSTLMIEIDPHLLKGKRMAELLMDDQGRWKRMKDKFREIRVRYYKLKEKVLKELDQAGLRISRRSKKVKQSVKKRKQNFVHDHVDPDVYDDYDYYKDHNMTNLDLNNHSTAVEEYEYEDIDSPDDSDEFEKLDDIKGICDQIDWNVINNDSTVYILTTYLISDKIVCSLSNVEADTEYEHVCEYVLDFCFANIICGKHGHCVNTLSGFKCSCSFLYGGLLCEKISKQGQQIIIGSALILFFYGLSFKPIRWLLVLFIKTIMNFCKYQSKVKKQKKKNKKDKSKEDKQKLVPKKKKEDETEDEAQQPVVIPQRRQTLAQEIMEFLREIYQYITLPRNVDPLKNPNKRDLVRLFWVGGLSVFFLILLFSVTTITHFTSFKYDITDDTKLDLLVNDTLRLVTQCEKISDYRMGNLIFFPIALSLILIFSWSVKREKRCLKLCDGRPGLIPPIEPFRTANRFTTATVFGILAFEVLKIFEELLFSTGDALRHGVLVEILLRIAVVILVGLRYYPVLASLQLRNVVSRFFVCLYITGDIIYAIIREGSCMGFLPISGYYSALEEAKLRIELGTWFIIYGLIKNTPHFIFLSYIGAELWVRFGYDSIYVPLKKKQSIWTAQVCQRDESEFARFYVAKLFRRTIRSSRKVQSTKANINKLVDYEYEAELQKQANQSRVKQFFNKIYHWDDDFRFTTMATCTYTVAIVFLYYLACTFVFLYISRTTGHIAFLRYYVETTLNIEFKGVFSLRFEVILSAVITVILYAFQLYIGIKNYKKHRSQLYKGIYVDVPSALNFKTSSIAAKSVHYSGFLVGYMAWGFVICFHLTFFLLSAIRIVSVQLRYLELILAICVPVLVVYLLKMVTTSSAGRFLFIQDMDEKLNLKNRKTYAIFIYFNFFADCFLGIASCIIRLIKATFLNVVYMARLDCSFLGRPLEKFDLGFAAYVSYLHMEVTHTNPIMLAFCYTLYDDVVRKRTKQCYDDECCIAPGELDDDELVIEQKPKAIKNVPSKTTKRDTNGSVSKKTKEHARETTSPARSITRNKNSIAIDDDNDDDDDGGLSIKEMKPKKKSPTPPTISEKSSQKSKKPKSSLQEEDDNDPSMPVTSTIARLIPQEQPRLPPPSTHTPILPVREDNPSEGDDVDDDGGIKPPSISTISKAIPQQQPRLLPVQRSSPPSSSPARVPKRQDLTDDDDEDDDGGIKPPSVSTLAKIIPQQQPRLWPIQQSSPPHSQPTQGAPPPRPQVPQAPPALRPQVPQGPPPLRPQAPQGSFPPRVPPRQDIVDDDEDDDGGINPKVIARQRRELEEKKKNKEEAKKKKQLDLEEEDDDGGVSKQKQLAAEKKKKELETKKKLQEQAKARRDQDDDEDDDDGGPNSKVIERQRRELEEKKKKKEEAKKKKQLDLDEEDDDGGVSKQKQLAAEKKKRELEAKKKLQEQAKARRDQDDDEDDDGGPKRQEPIHKKKPVKTISKSEILREEDEDEDGGRIVKTYDTVRMIMPKKQPILNNQRKKSPSPEADADADGSMSTTKRAQQPLLASYDTVGRIVPKVSTDFRRIKEDNHYDTIPTDEERAARVNAVYSPPSYDQASNPNDLHLLRTISYREAQHSTPPLTQRRPTGTPSIRSHSNTNEDSSHYSEITNDTAHSGVINRSYSNTGSIRSASNHSIKQASQHTLKEEQQTEESIVETEEEEEEEEEEQEKPLKAKRAPTSNMSTAYETLGYLFKPKEAAEITKARKKKQARFRWFLAYTILNNYHLFDLRKQVQSRLALLRIQRSNLFDDQQQTAAAASVVVPVQKSFAISEFPESPGAKRSARMRLIPPTPEVPVSPEQRAVMGRRLLSVPIPIIDDFPQSPAERYIAIRSCMLYDTNMQQINSSQVPSTASQQAQMQLESRLGVLRPPNVVIQPPSNSSIRSKDKRPTYERQESHHSTPLIINQFTGTPTFQALPESTHSTTDYPIANSSSITNFSTLRTQMSHAQHTQAWQLQQTKKYHKKRPYCYIYGPPPQRPLEEKVATAAILTPQLILPNGETQRGFHNLPFQFPPQDRTINEKTKNKQGRQRSPVLSSHIEENNQDTSIKKKTLRTTAAIIHRKDSQSSVSNVTEV